MNIYYYRDPKRKRKDKWFFVTKLTKLDSKKKVFVWDGFQITIFFMGACVFGFGK